MAIYEYQCSDTSCSFLWEEQQSMTDKPLEICPKCLNKTATKLISKSSFVLSGGGWASSGYSNK